MVATTSSGELVVSEISIDRDGERIRNIDTTSVRSGIRRYELDPWGFAVDEDSLLIGNHIGCSSLTLMEN